ncbi:hypothetical protein KUM39_06150 [Streptomyces sp. J2-1]|uniref:hypothetical protein n=1 Tax=Streptomyces corallincola TaxID=2851888 RepID=UPI001C389398|nr:hypothetical protein [Streptomyces corallincola]MBV2353945.1 hypothetical protein [Streptomyces corallincola]
MTPSRSRRAVLSVAVAGAALLALGSAAPVSAQEMPGPGMRFYTGTDRTGTETLIDENDTGVCRELPAPQLSYTALTTHNVEIYFNPGCQKGFPGATGDFYYLSGTFNGGDLPFPALSYRVREGA